MKFIIHTGYSDYTLPSDLQALGLSDQRVYLKPLVDMAPLVNAIPTLMDVNARDKG
jgi:hypothetical protein